jgi:hypothetical protein
MKTYMLIVKIEIIFLLILGTFINYAQEPSDKEVKDALERADKIINRTRENKTDTKTNSTDTKSERPVTHYDFDEVTIEVNRPASSKPDHSVPFKNSNYGEKPDHSIKNTIGEVLENAGKEGEKFAWDEITGEMKEYAIKMLLGKFWAGVYRVGSSALLFVSLFLEPEPQLSGEDVLYNTKGERVWKGMSIEEREKLQVAFDQKLKDALNAKDNYDLDIKIKEAIDKYEKQCIQDALVDKMTSIKPQESHLDAVSPDINRRTSPRPKFNR